MPTGPNRILDAANNITTATVQSIVVNVLSDLIYGKSLQNEIGLKVLSIGSTSPPSGGTFTSSAGLVTSSGNIPAGVLGWSVTAVSGTVTVTGGAAIPVGASVGGGGYSGYVTQAAIAYTIAAGSAIVAYDLPT